MTDVTCVPDAKAELGECPVWSADEQALYWVDIYAPALHRLDPATGDTRTWPMPDTIGSYGLRASGGAVVVLRDRFALLDFDTGKVTDLAAPDRQVPGTRFNDGKVSPDGRFLAGTMDEEQLSRPIASLYRLDRDGTVHRLLDGLIVSNGLAWTRDGRTMFHSDSKGQVIRDFPYDPTDGSLGEPRVLARPTDEQGRPDGAAADVESFYWSAGISAGVLNRWSPDGRLDRSIRLPCSNPAMPCFGGPDLKTIYVTSLRHDVPRRGAGGQAVVGWDLRRPGRRGGGAGRPLRRLNQQEVRHVERLHGRSRNDGHLALRGPAAGTRLPTAHRGRPPAEPGQGRRGRTRRRPAARLHRGVRGEVRLQEMGSPDMSVGGLNRP
jgi:sugar lactone lactonase YvrE